MHSDKFKWKARHFAKLTIPQEAQAIQGIDKATLAALAASEGKADDIVVLDVDGISNVTDSFLIFTGQSPSHLRAVANRVLEALKAHGFRPFGTDGARSPGWVAYDYGNLIIHGMLDEVRRYYEIERLWGDARVVDWEAPSAEPASANN